MKPIHTVPKVWVAACLLVCLYRIMGAATCSLMGFRVEWLVETLVGLVVFVILASLIILGAFISKEP